MGMITLLFLCEVLGIALLKFTGIEDAYILLTMAAVIIGAFWKLKMEQQKIRIDAENRDADYKQKILEQDTKMAELAKQVANKVDSTTCHLDHKESKRLFSELTAQLSAVNLKIDSNHSEVLNTIIQLLHTKEDRIL